MKTPFSFAPKFVKGLGLFWLLLLIPIAGILLNGCDKTIDAISPSNERIRTRMSGVTVQQGMLRFDDMDAVNDFLDSIEMYRAKYYSLNDNSMLLSQVDPGINDMEDNLGYLSLSSYYDSLEYIDDEFRYNESRSGDIYFGDPDLQALLNRHHEVWVEDTIYKAIAKYKYFKIVGADIDVLNSIRSDPEEPTVDTNTYMEYFNGPSIKMRSACTPFIEFVQEPPVSGLSPTVHIKLKMIDQDGNVSLCQAGQISIDWGDGDTEGPLNHNNIVSHIYDPDPDATTTYEIEASLNLLFPSSCLGCDEGTYKATIKYTVSNDFCFNTNSDKNVLPATEFTVGSGEWKVSGNAGQNPRFRFLNDPKVWGEILLYKKNNNGNYKRKRPDDGCSVREFKSTFNHTDCENGENTFDETERHRDSRVCVRYKDHREFSTQNELSDEPLLDFRVFISSSVSASFSSTNRELFPD